MVGGRSYLFQPPRRAVGPSGINPSFLGLSRYQGWVTHVLLTRSPLSPDPKVWFSLDLHVLSAPPAFVLSQDQTLREDGCRHMVPPAILSLRASYLLKGHFHSLFDQGASATRSNPLARAGRSLSEIEVLDIEERSLLSFQRPVPCLKDGVKKTSDSRQEASVVRIVAYTSRAWRLLWSSYRAFLRTPVRTAWEV